jgi:hypothetical protein
MSNSQIQQSSFLHKENISFRDTIFKNPEVKTYHFSPQTKNRVCNHPNSMFFQSNESFIRYNSFQNFSHLHRSSTFNTTKTEPDQLSKVEEELLKSKEPIEFPIENSNEEIEVLGEKGIWLNKNESFNWHGSVPLCNYEINQDKRPQIIYKKSNCELNYIQELAIRYLRPPTPPKPGDVVIVQEPNKETSSAPPLIIRQQPARAATPEPLVIREAPPKQPPIIGKKLIIISGKRLPPPPRKVCKFIINTYVIYKK